MKGSRQSSPWNAQSKTQLNGLHVPPPVLLLLDPPEHTPPAQVCPDGQSALVQQADAQTHVVPFFV